MPTNAGSNDADLARTDGPTDRNSPATDEALLDRARAGDAESLTTLLSRFAGAARARLNISKPFTGLIDADDVMQVTYTEAFLRISSFQSGNIASFVAWISTMAQNNLRDAIKELERGKRPDPRRRIAPSGDDSCFALLEMVGATTSTPSVRAARGEARRMLDAAINELPELYQRVIRRYDLEGCGVETVAAELQRSSGAVYMLRARALDMLRDTLGNRSQFLSAD